MARLKPLVPKNNQGKTLVKKRTTTKANTEKKITKRIKAQVKPVAKDTLKADQEALKQLSHQVVSVKNNLEQQKNMTLKQKTVLQQITNLSDALTQLVNGLTKKSSVPLNHRKKQQKSIKETINFLENNFLKVLKIVKKNHLKE